MKTIVVTGGGRGIGRAVALSFAGPDAHVVIAARTAEQLDEVAAEIEAKGGSATAIPMDVTDEASVAHGLGLLHGRVRRVDVLVNNAGIGGGEPVQGSDIARWKRTLDTNLFGVYLVTRHLLPLMGMGGRIVSLSSVLGRFGVPGYTAYCASKHGVIGFTRALALEVASRGITANAICPGWADTEMATSGMQQGAEATGLTFEQFRERALGAVPIKRIIQPEEVAGHIHVRPTPQAEAITGQTYNICGGQTMD